jgi:hypothetical protein
MSHLSGMIPDMEPRTATQSAPPRVTFSQIEAVLKDMPVDLLPEVYRYLVERLEEAEDLAAIDAAKDEPTRPFSEFVAELERENLYP